MIVYGVCRMIGSEAIILRGIARTVILYTGVVLIAMITCIHILVIIIIVVVVGVVIVVVVFAVGEGKVGECVHSIENCPSCLPVVNEL